MLEKDLGKVEGVILEFRLGSGRSNSDGDNSNGIPKDKGKGSNKGKDIKDWRAGRGEK